MIEIIFFIALAELLIFAVGFAIWTRVKHIRQRRAFQQAGELLQHIWLQREDLHQEVLRKRLLALHPGSDNLSPLIETVLERERILVQQVAQGLVQPSVENLTLVVNGISRHGDLYSHLNAHKE